MQVFHRIAHLLTVNDISDPVNRFDISQSVAEVNEQWMEECTGAPDDEIAIVTDGRAVVGWLYFEQLLADTPLSQCMAPLPADAILSSNTPLIDAVQILNSRSHDIYFVLTHGEITSWFASSHFFRLPFKLCLLALVLGLEQLMLEVLASDSDKYLDHLSAGRRTIALGVYKNRRYRLDKEGQPYTRRLIDCTNLIDKFTMLRRDPLLLSECPAIKPKGTWVGIESLRNRLVHPDSEDELFPFGRHVDELSSVIANVEKLYEELERFLAKPSVI